MRQRHRIKWVNRFLGNEEVEWADTERPVKEVRKQLEDVNARLAKYYEAFEQGRLEPEFVRERTGTLKQQKKALEAETLAAEYHVSKSHVLNYLGLLRIPVDLRVRLKKDPNVAEGHLRPFTRMNPVAMRVAVERLLGLGVVAKAG